MFQWKVVGLGVGGEVGGLILQERLVLVQSGGFGRSEGQLWFHLGSCLGRGAGPADGFLLGVVFFELFDEAVVGTDLLNRVVTIFLLDLTNRYASS